MHAEGGWMNDTSMLNLLLQGGSFAVLVTIILWVIWFVPKRIDRADDLREKESGAKKEAAESLQKLVSDQEHSHLMAVQKISDSIYTTVESQEKAHLASVDKMIT